MTIGIYLLKFNGTNKVYVGQSLRIEERLTKHKYNLANNIASIKLQQAYLLYGVPYLEVLLECTLEDNLDMLENEAIEIFNSVNNGFNINSKAGGGGTGLQGDAHPNSKYSKETILTVFKNLLLDIPFKDIAKTTGVEISTIRDISKGKSHKWLASLYSEDYECLLSLKHNRSINTAKHKNIKYPIILSPNNTAYTISNLSEFARQHDLNKSHLCGVLNKVRKTHKGWKLA
jgi:group I intron endonuclease